jgi:branched-chain amino acid transport system substrate-binding protein
MSVAGAAWSPAEGNALRRRAAMHTLTLANVFLKRHELIELLTSTDSPHLSVLLLDAFLRRELLLTNPALDSLNLFASTLEARYASTLSPAYRTMLENIRQQIAQARSGTMRRFRIGVILPFSLDIFDGLEQPSLGEKMMLGILQAAAAYHQLAVGNRIDLLIYPCMRDDSLALRTMLTELLERESVHLILGPAYSRQAVLVSQFCAEKGVPMLTPTATDERITRHIPTSFQLNPTYTVRGKAIANFLIESLGAKTFGVLAQDSTYGKLMAEGFREAVLAAGGEMKFYGILPTQLRGISQALAPLKLKAHPQKGFPETVIDAVYIPMSNFESIAIAVEQLKFYNIKTRIIGSGDWHDPLLLHQYRSIGDSVIYAIDSHISPDAPETKRVSDAFAAIWGVLPDLQFWFGYDAMDFVVATVIEKGLTDRADIVNAIRNAPLYPGHRSEIFFGGGNINLKMHIMKFQNGRLTKLQ